MRKGEVDEYENQLIQLWQKVHMFLEGLYFFENFIYQRLFAFNYRHLNCFFRTAGATESAAAA